MLYGRNELHFYCQIAALNSQKKNDCAIDWVVHRLVTFKNQRESREAETEGMDQVWNYGRVEGVVLCYWQTTWNPKIPKDNRIKRTLSS